MKPDPDATAIRAAVQAVRGGDREAFATIVQVYQRRVFGLALMMTRDAAAVEEVAQDALVRAFVKLDAYDAARPFYPWVSTIAVRLAQNWLVSRSRLRAHEEATVAPDASAAADTPDPLLTLIADEEDRTLWRAVAALPFGERAAVVLHYRQGMSVGEIASALGVTAGTVKTQLFRARGKLRTALGAIRFERAE